MRSYALALLAASGSAAMPASYNMGTTTAKVSFVDIANTYKEIATGQALKWGYDAAKLYVSYDAVGLAKTPLPATPNDSQSVGVKVKVGSGAVNLVCAHLSAAGTTSNAYWFASPTSSAVAVAGANCNTKAWAHASCMGADITELTTLAPAAPVADGTEQTAVSATKTVTNNVYTILATSKSKLDSVRTTITCHMDIEIALASATLTLNQAAAVGLNKINAEVVQNFGDVKLGSDNKTYWADATFFNYSPTAPTAVPTTATKYSTAAGIENTGLVVTHTVNAWTSTTKVYIDYTWKMTLTAALTSGPVNSATTCSKILAAVWQCAIMETTGVASSKVILKFKAYRSNEKLSFTTGLPEIAGNLGKVANVVKEYEMTNIAAGTAAATDIVSLPSGFVGAMLASNKWAWYATGNKMDAAFKVFDGKVQYFSTETDAAGATAVMTAVTEYAKTAWVGSCLGATCKYGAKELAATSAAAAGAGSLGLASVGAAIVLAMAF